jgi:hypothetical protein
MRKTQRAGLIAGALAAIGLGLSTAACGSSGGGAVDTVDDTNPVSTYVLCHATSKSSAVAYIDLANINGEKAVVNAKIIVDGKTVKTIKSVKPAGSKTGGTDGVKPPEAYAGDPRTGHAYYQVNVPAGGIVLEVRSTMDYAKHAPGTFKPSSCKS